MRNHLRHYWEPRMRDALLAHVDATGGTGLHAHVLAGAKLLREPGAAKTGYPGPPKGVGVTRVVERCARPPWSRRARAAITIAPPSPPYVL